MRRALTDAAVATVWQPAAGGVVGAVAVAAAGSGLQSLAAAATASKERDEVRLTYGVVVSGRAVVPDVTAGARVTSSGQDVFTPLVADAAKAIVPALATAPRGGQ